jgi:hypothetical protein
VAGGGGAALPLEQLSLIWNSHRKILSLTKKSTLFFFFFFLLQARRMAILCVCYLENRGLLRECRSVRRLKVAKTRIFTHS